MELRYNLTQQDFKRGMLLHEKRLKGPLTVIRKVEWFFFLAMALFGIVMLVMLATILAVGQWEEDYGTVLGLSVVTLVGSLAFLWVLSARRRAFHGVRLMAGEGDFFGPRTLSLTREGVAVTFGVGRRVEPYDALVEVWEKKGYVILYLKRGIWEVVPPCAFSGRRSGRPSSPPWQRPGRAGRPGRRGRRRYSRLSPMRRMPLSPSAMPGRRRPCAPSSCGPTWPTSAPASSGGLRWY